MLRNQDTKLEAQNGTMPVFSVYFKSNHAIIETRLDGLNDLSQASGDSLPSVHL